MAEAGFEFVPRMNTPLIIGLSGPSTSGKTGSALELAHGFQDAQGGDIAVLDSEAGRGNHLQEAPMFSDKAKVFKYRYKEFSAPFSPMEYQRLIGLAVKSGVKHLIIDSMSHMHESEGGILQWHEQEAERMARSAAAKYNKEYNGDHERYNGPAWAKPKAAVSQFRSFFTQQKINLIFCFRAKPKMNIKTGKSLGYQPIITDDIVFEMTTRLLLYPLAAGVPTFEADQEAQDERKFINIPEQFLPIFSDRKRPLSAWHGRQMALWAKGKSTAATPAPAAKPATTPAAL